MQALKLAIRLFCLVPFGTGIADMTNGVGLLVTAGARLAGVATDPVLNSQVGFWGAIWFGFGAVLWRASFHLTDEVDLFRLLCGIILLSGLARVGAAVAYGSPGPILTVAMGIELVGGLGLVLWHGALPRYARPQTA